jgi:hypothetical protein
MEFFTEEHVSSKVGKQVKAKRVIMVKTKSRYKSLPKGTLGKVAGVKVKDLDGYPLYRISIEWKRRSPLPFISWFIAGKRRRSPPLISYFDEWQYDRFVGEV